MTAGVCLGQFCVVDFNYMTQERALSILKTGANVFLTGEPGTGKTHTVNAYIEYLQSHDIDLAITASTGIAATHIGGMTIHSWSGIGIKSHLDVYDLDRIASNEYVAKRILRAKVLIIDEISMLPPETLSMVDAVCREVKKSDEPFGGIQLVFVGDFFQLPPIMKRTNAPSGDIYDSQLFVEGPVERFSFDSPAWKRSKPIVCYLSKQYRQDDESFLTVLSAIRGNIFDEMHLEILSERKIERSNIPENVPKLYSHNVDVDTVNGTMLNAIEDDERVFEMTQGGKEALVATLKKGCLSPERLFLKVGASVMFTKNNPREGFVNGTLGIVEGFDDVTGMPVVKTRSGEIITVSPMEWSVEEGGKIRAHISQVPLRLAWAITVHKSQGMSLDEAVMDLGSVFEYGQGYVALSRVRRLTGLHILGWNARAFEVHPYVLEHDIAFRESSCQADEAFQKLSAEELTKMHTNFITALGGTLGTSSKKKSGKSKSMNTREETLVLLLEGKNLAQIAEARELKEATILDHIETLITQKRLTKKECEHLPSPELLDAMPVITKAFKKVGDEKLTPVFEYLKGEYSFDDLRLARFLIKK